MKISPCICLIVALMFLPFGVRAQSEPFGGSYVPPKLEVLDTARFKVVYDWTYNHPMSNGARTTECTLLVGPKISKYGSTTEIRGDSLQYAERNANMSLREWMRKTNQEGAYPREVYLLRQHDREDSIEVHDRYLVRLGNMADFPEFYYEETATGGLWQPTGNSKTIRGIECSEAKGRLHGRDWTIWFAESIPIFEGPWELSGAPGLILEAYDSENEHQFTLAEMGPNRSLILRADKPGRKKVTRDKMRELRSADARSQLKSYVAAGYATSIPNDIEKYMNYIDLE